MNKSMKPSRQKVASLTPEEKKEQIIRFLSQKRESFTTGILFNLCQSSAGEVPTEAEAIALVDRAVAMADHLLESLYPLKEESETTEAE